MPRRPIAALLLLALAGPAVADGPPPVELPLLGGTTIAGVVESADAAEVVLAVGAGERRRVPWSQLAPLGVFRARAALAKPDDGPARLALAEMASELGLWAEARAEYEKALALGAVDAARYRDAVADAERRAVESGIGRAERAADAGDLAAALEILRGLALDFADAVDPKRVAGLVASLEARIRARDADQQKAQDAVDRLLLDADRQREVLGRFTEARRRMAIGAQRHQDAAEPMERGAVSEVRRLVEAGDEAYGTARRELGRLRRIVRKDEPERVKVLATLAELDKAQYRLLFAAAKFFWDERVYARAEDYAARASYIDPVDPALLELRGELRDKRIKYRVSDLTNARPHVR